MINLENTITSLTEKIKQTKQVSDVDIEDNVKQFDVKTQNILPLASFVNVVRCSSITKEETNALRRKIRAWNFVVPTLSFVQEALSPSSPPVLALDFLTHNVNQLVKNLIMSLNVLRIKKKVLVS